MSKLSRKSNCFVRAQCQGGEGGVNISKCLTKHQLLKSISACRSPGMSGGREGRMGGRGGRERERERERERILLRSIVNMMIHVQIKTTMKIMWIDPRRPALRP